MAGETPELDELEAHDHLDHPCSLSQGNVRVTHGTRDVASIPAGTAAVQACDCRRVRCRVQRSS